MADFEPKTWTADATDENVIRASDCERWQDGVEQFGGSWPGSWEDSKDTLTAEQLNALETEINKFNSSFTVKTYSDGDIPGVDEWNRIEEGIAQAIEILVAFAIYSDTDKSLTFYSDSEAPEEGGTYKGKNVTAVYTGFDTATYTSSSSVPWHSNRSNVTSVVIDSSFANVQCVATAFWFYNHTTVTACTGLEYMNTSSVTNMTYMFRACTGLTTLDVSNFDTSKVTNMGYMFRACTGLTTLDVSNFDTSKVTNMGYMFYGCSGLTTIYSDDNKFVTTKVTSGGNMFTDCSKLVGGNGTAYDSSNVTYTMAHVDTADNPGYFTAKG